MENRTNFRAVLYARKSISDRTGDESGSITEQLESGRLYAASQGWTVVGEFADDGVSAANAPDERAGWKSLLEADGYDRVVVRHIDRVSRRLRDFLDTNDDLETRGAALVAVRQNLDMSSPNGRLFAQILAVFAEYERELIRERVAGTRQHNLRNGRVVGGTIPYGWRSLPNPDGKGYVLRHDPDRIEWVRGMVKRFKRGDTLYSITRWLDSEGAPLPKASQKNRAQGSGWNYLTVERLLRNPVLAGAIPFNPGNTSKERGSELLRDEFGLPVVMPDVAIMPIGEWRALVEQLDSRDSPQSRPRASRNETSSLLSGLMFCTGKKGKPHDEPVKMWRGTVQGRECYQCPDCYQTISNFEQELVDHFLEQKGDWVRWSKVKQAEESGSAVLPEIEQRLSELDGLIRDASPADRAKLRAEQDSLLDLRDTKRQEKPRLVDVWEPTDDYFSELWHQAETDEDRRAVLQDALERVLVKPGLPGRRKVGDALKRLECVWKRPDEVGPRSLAV